MNIGKYTILKYGDITPFKDPITGKNFIYAGIDTQMKYKNLPCIYLATDLENKKTHSRYNIEWLNERGYNVLLKIKYTTTIYNKANPDGKTITKISTGAPVESLDFIITSNDTINLKNDNMRYLIEPENIIKIYDVRG